MIDMNTNADLVKVVASFLDVGLTAVSNPSAARKPSLRLRVLQGYPQKPCILLAHLPNRHLHRC